jgi:hypothetical protein
LSENGLKTLFFLHDNRHRTLESYANRLKARMIISIEECEDHLVFDQRPSNNTTPYMTEHLFDESDV